MKIEITTAVEGKIIGQLKQKHDSRRLLVVCNGLRTSVDHPATKAIAQKLYEHGHAVFTFNFSDTHGMDIERQVEDIRDIIAHFTPYDEIVLIGGSLGALTVAIAANQSPKVKGVITVNGFFGSGNVGGYLLTKYVVFRLLTAVSTKHRKFWQFYKRRFRPQQLDLPVLVIHSTADKHVSIKQSRDFFAQLPGPKEFQTLTISDHNLMPLTEIGAIVQMIDEWSRKHF